MKILMILLAVALVVTAPAYGGEEDHEMFKQLCILLDLDKDDTQKLAVAFVTLEENLDAATRPIGDPSVGARKIMDDFDMARSTFRDSVNTFMSPEQFNSMVKYIHAIFYELAEDIALIRVTKYEKSLKLSEQQVTSLTLVVNEELRSVVETLLEYGEGDINQQVADALDRSLTGIREDTVAEVQRILTDEQFTKLQELRTESAAESG